MKSLHYARQTSDGPVIRRYPGRVRFDETETFRRPEYSHVDAALVAAWLNGRDIRIPNMVPLEQDTFYRERIQQKCSFVKRPEQLRCSLPDGHSGEHKVD